MTSYICSACGQPVAVSKDGTITRKCEHTRASVTASMGASCVGAGSLRGQKESALSGFTRWAISVRNKVLKK